MFDCRQAYLRDSRTGDPLKERSPAWSNQEPDEVQTEGSLVCAACGSPVTDESQRTNVQGSHDHFCINPADEEFHIGCFVNAPGCAVGGVPTEEYSWFPGYKWRYALCASCGEHLGWEFSGLGNFFGLVLDRLKKAE